MFHYIYPINKFPYSNIQKSNQGRGKNEQEFEVWDTGIYDNDKFFDIEIIYAKESEEDILQKIKVKNCSDKEESIWVLPQVWFRNYWNHEYCAQKPILQFKKRGEVELYHENLGEYHVYYSEGGRALFCDNETNTMHVYGVKNTEKYTKNGINDFITKGEETVNETTRQGTKFAAAYELVIGAGETQEVMLRFSKEVVQNPFENAEECFKKREEEANNYYDDLCEEHLIKKQNRKIFVDA